MSQPERASEADVAACKAVAEALKPLTTQGNGGPAVTELDRLAGTTGDTSVGRALKSLSLAIAAQIAAGSNTQSFQDAVDRTSGAAFTLVAACSRAGVTSSRTPQASAAP